ncbi:SMI1/KNR4 family protein [Nocardiopsis prasina]|uniref:SMI1/KNR4 family protein n=1 Tax=Nocardiopsis prasina TaxID=2015 RepID=UPI000382BE3E|nr:SMI1/KNR4 family protein [Nocardiopsis prasina]
MSDEYFARISQLIGEPPVSGQWFDSESIERVLGRSLPPDYVALMSKYGGIVSTIDDADLLFSVAGIKGMDSREVIEEGNYPVYYLAEDVSEFMFVNDPRRVRTSWIVSRDPYNLFCVGEMFGENVYVFYDPDLSSWTVVLGSGDLWWQFRGGVCELLAKMVTGEIDLPYLEQGYFSGSAFIQEPRLVEEY